MSFSQKEAEQIKAEQIFVGKTIVRVVRRNGSLSLFTKDNKEIFIFPGCRGATEYDGDSISFWSKANSKKR